MQQGELHGMRVAILVTNDFEQVEMTEPRKALEQAGAKVMLISPVQGQVQAVKHDVKADTFPVDLTIDHAKPEDFDAVLLPGGALNADALRMHPKAQQFIKEIDSAGKPIAVICHAPWLLVSAGLVKGRKLTSYYTLQDDIRNAGGQWVDQETVRDGNWISSREPKDIPAFNREMVRLFSEMKGKMRKAA
ncbi:MAG: type 1 glutamine amidotransferase domain-containing protein [Chloroflexota bacterium]|jgi:protease I